MGENNIVYFAGWLGGKFFKTHSCVASKKCELLLEGTEFSGQSQLLLYLSVKNPTSSDFGKLLVPSASFRNFSEACEHLFEASAQNLVSYDCVGQALCSLFDEKVEKCLIVCNQAAYEELFRLFTRVRLQWFARERNAELRSVAAHAKARGQVRRLSTWVYWYICCCTAMVSGLFSVAWQASYFFLLGFTGGQVQLHKWRTALEWKRRQSLYTIMYEKHLKNTSPSA